MVDEELEADYLVIGAGAAGMAFTDALLEHSDATVTIVDRRHAPGGHWIDAYPYVRLHQPSAFYGVSSVPLGQDALDVAGTNAGYYELAGADEIRAYFANVMHRRFLPSGRVRYFPSSEYQGDGRFVSQLAQLSWKVHVRRKVVDTTYLEGAIPSTSAPPFEVADGVRCVPAGEIVRVRERPERFVIIGAGKTALDACVWLLEQGVPALAIRWIKPREAWWVNRRFHQPHALLPDFYRGMAIQLEAMAQATSVQDLFARLEAEEFFLRIDPRCRSDHIFLGGADTAEHERFARLQRESATAETAAALLRLVYRLDVRACFPLVRSPATVVHRRDDRAVPYRLGREVAAAIPGATFIPLQGISHFPWHGDVDSVVRACRQGLAPHQSPAADAGELEPVLLSRREREILACVAHGLGDREIAEQLQLSPHTVHRHVANIRRKLGSHVADGRRGSGRASRLLWIAETGHHAKDGRSGDARDYPSTRRFAP